MCRIGFDAAPDYIYPNFVSDLYVVKYEKFNSCGLMKQDMDKRMKPGDKYMHVMRYHPEEMGFGGPTVYFDWDKNDLFAGWLMDMWWDKNSREKHTKNVKRFIAMRKAGYPVVCSVTV